MSFPILAALIFGSAAGGSTPNLSEPAPSNIGISDIEQLRPGEMTADEVRAAFGKPNQAISLSSQEDVWIYLEPTGEDIVQRASLVIDRQSGLLLTATLLMRGSDPLNQQDEALKYFDSTRLRARDVGWIARHSYSDEAIYEDPKSGVSLWVNKTPRTVSAISFSAPK